jgi:hypothetical protein
MRDKMTITALFVDLPNLYGQLLGSRLGESKFLRDYFVNWLDFDMLAQKITGLSPTPSVWIFYSGGRLGPPEARIDGVHLNNFVNRVNSLEGVTARDVNIPGEQREALEIRCEKCGHETVTMWKSEKGIDASLTVHLFDTMDSWSTAYLLSGDADFVPVVASLRRRGKVVIGAGFPNASSALVRECYSYVDLAEAFFKEDLVAYLLFKVDGLLKKWFTEVQLDPDYSAEKLSLAFQWWRENPPSRGRGVRFFTEGFKDTPVTRWKQELLDLCAKLEGPFEIFSEREFVHPNFGIKIDSTHWRTIERRLQTLVSSIEGLQQLHENYFRIEYHYERDTNEYVLNAN